MYTVDDAKFAVLHSCASPMSSARLSEYLYIYQLAGLNYEFRYRFVASHIKSAGVDSVISRLINDDFIVIEDGDMVLSETGLSDYESTILSYAEWAKLDYIKSILDSLTDSQLYFVVVSCMIVSKYYNKYGVNYMLEHKDVVTNAVASLSVEYDEENFDAAMKIYMIVSGGLK